MPRSVLQSQVMPCLSLSSAMCASSRETALSVFRPVASVLPVAWRSVSLLAWKQISFWVGDQVTCSLHIFWRQMSSAENCNGLFAAYVIITIRFEIDLSKHLHCHLFFLENNIHSLLDLKQITQWIMGAFSVICLHLIPIHWKSLWTTASSDGHSAAETDLARLMPVIYQAAFIASQTSVAAPDT